MRKAAIVSLVALLGGMMLGMWLMVSFGGWARWDRTRAGPTIEQVQQLAELVTVRAQVADAQQTSLAGYTGSIRAALLVKGEILVGVDLSQARFEQEDEVHRVAVLRLTRPRVLAARLDHERTKVFGVSTRGLWLMVPGGGDADAAVIDRAYREAQEGLEKAADNPELRRRAANQAELELREFCSSIGWQVEIRWSD
jgi:hypothetical protein